VNAEESSVQWRELLPMALRALAANRLRSALTLLGLVAGLAPITPVMPALAREA